MTVPKLRFPEFKEDWIEKRLSRFLVPSFREVPKPDTAYLAIGVRSHGKGTFQKPNANPEAIAMESLFRVHQNDLIVNITFAWEGAIAIVRQEDEGGLVSHRFPTYQFDETTVTHKFFKYVIDNRRFRQKLELISPGGAGRNRVLSKSEFLKLEHHFPSFSEQKKIAAFLSAVDAKIDALRNKRLGLIRYKAGLMKRFFSKTFRFTNVDGKAFPKWKEKTFGQLYDFVTTNSLSRDSLSYSEGKIQNIHYGDIHTRFKSRFRQEDEKVPFIKYESDKEKIDDEQFCKVGDIVIADASEDYADIGKAIEIISVKDKSLVAGLHTFIARPKSNDTVVGYSGYLLQTFAMRRQIMRIAQGISVLGISKLKLAKLSVPLPHVDEQRKIADALAAIDGKIQIVAVQISRMEAFRKSLLQKMFV